MRNRTTKRKKKTLPTPAAATAIPVKPRTAASSATMKKMRAQRSIANPPLRSGKNDWRESAESGGSGPYSGKGISPEGICDEKKNCPKEKSQEHA
jgi:hypothetical protein